MTYIIAEAGVNHNGQAEGGVLAHVFWIGMRPAARALAVHDPVAGMDFPAAVRVDTGGCG